MDVYRSVEHLNGDGAFSENQISESLVSFLFKDRQQRKTRVAFWLPNNDIHPLNTAHRPTGRLLDRFDNQLCLYDRNQLK